MTQKFLALNLEEKTIQTFAKNKKVVAKLSEIAQLAGGKAERTQGNLLYALSTKLPPSQDGYMKTFVENIMNNKWTRVN